MQRKNRDDASKRYEDLFLLFTEKVEKALTVALIILLLALVVSQMLLKHPQIRYLLVKVEQLEGNPYSAASVEEGN